MHGSTRQARLVSEAPYAGAPAAAPGQSLVLYDGDHVLGGGVIERAGAAKRELPVMAA